MIKKNLLLCLITMYLFKISAQVNQVTNQADPGITVWLSSDTILHGSYLELKYVINNLEGSFEEPVLDNFRIISGPNVGQSISIINGVRTSTQTYSYVLSPLHLGTSIIEPAFYQTKTESLRTDEISIVSLGHSDLKISNEKSQKGITLFFGLDPKSERPIKKKINQYKKRKL